MLSAVIFAGAGPGRSFASPEAIVRTLASLVPAAIAGTVRDVTLAAMSGAPGARQIADHAGCELVEAATPGDVLRAAIAAARGDLLFVLLAGRAPEPGFDEEETALFDRASDRTPRAAELRAEPGAFLHRLIPAISPVEGLIARRRDMAAGAADFAGLRRALSAPVAMKCRLRRVG